jgi:hypothetical protein
VFSLQDTVLRAHIRLALNAAFRFVVAAVAAFVVSSVWYILFNKERMKLLGINQKEDNHV